MAEAVERHHSIAVVIPVYRGERTLRSVVTELIGLAGPESTPGGRLFEISEIVLVYDHGDDASDEVIRELDQEFEVVRPVWLSRNFGQHPATLAGMSSTGADWIVTIDEDGQHDPKFIPLMLDTALNTRRSVVYGVPSNAPPHGPLRNLTSRIAKWLFVKVLAQGNVVRFSSYRLVMGEHGRSVAAYCGPGVFLDVALGWIAGEASACPVTMRVEGDRPSGYSYRSLLSHFWRLVITSGTRPLRIASFLGFLIAISGFVLAIFLLLARILDWITVPGWTSVIVANLLGTGVLLITMGVIAEYLGSAVKMSMGQPLYLITTDPARSPLGREADDSA